MPPLHAQTVEIVVRHRQLQESQVLFHERIAPGVTHHRLWGKLVEFRRHARVLTPIVHQGCVDRNSVGMHRTKTFFRIRDVLVLRRIFPEQLLRFPWPIRVPNFQPITKLLEIILRAGQLLRDTRQYQSACARRIQRVSGHVVLGRVAQIDHDCRIDLCNIDQLRIGCLRCRQDRHRDSEYDCETQAARH